MIPYDLDIPRNRAVFCTHATPIRENGFGDVRIQEVEATACHKHQVHIVFKRDVVGTTQRFWHLVNRDIGQSPLSRLFSRCGVAMRILPLDVAVNDTTRHAAHTANERSTRPYTSHISLVSQPSRQMFFHNPCHSRIAVLFFKLIKVFKPTFPRWPLDRHPLPSTVGHGIR